jgi:hypothetical protein
LKFIYHLAKFNIALVRCIYEFVSSFFSLHKVQTSREGKVEHSYRFVFIRKMKFWVARQRGHHQICNGSNGLYTLKSYSSSIKCFLVYACRERVESSPIFISWVKTIFIIWWSNLKNFFADFIQTLENWQP